jgi:hypothetical protein
LFLLHCGSLSHAIAHPSHRAPAAEEAAPNPENKWIKMKMISWLKPWLGPFNRIYWWTNAGFPCNLMSSQKGGQNPKAKTPKCFRTRRVKRPSHDAVKCSWSYFYAWPTSSDPRFQSDTYQLWLLY